VSLTQFNDQFPVPNLTGETQAEAKGKYNPEVLVGEADTTELDVTLS